MQEPQLESIESWHGLPSCHVMQGQGGEQLGWVSSDDDGAAYMAPKTRAPSNRAEKAHCCMGSRVGVVEHRCRFSRLRVYRQQFYRGTANKASELGVAK